MTCYNLFMRTSEDGPLFVLSSSFFTGDVGFSVYDDPELVGLVVPVDIKEEDRGKVERVVYEEMKDIGYSDVKLEWRKVEE